MRLPFITLTAYGYNRMTVQTPFGPIGKELSWDEQHTNPKKLIRKAREKGFWGVSTIGIHTWVAPNSVLGISFES